MKTYNSRKEVPEKYKWNLDDFYKNDKDFDKDYNEVVKSIPKLKEFKGHLKDANKLYEFLELDVKISLIYENLNVYAYVVNDQELGVEESIKRLNKIEKVEPLYIQNTSFFEPELLSLSKEEFKDLFKKNSELNKYKKYLENVYRNKEHYLDEDKKNIVTSLVNAMDKFELTSSNLINNEIDYHTINVDGEEVQLALTNLRRFMRNKDEKIRKQAYFQFYKEIDKHSTTFATLLDSYVGMNNELAKIHNFKSSWEEKLFYQKLSNKVYDTLIKTTENNLAPLHRYYELTAKLQNKDKLRSYDLSLLDISSKDIKYSIEDAIELVKKATEPLGEEYSKKINKIFDNHYIDYCQYKGKQSGGYSISTYTRDSRILMSFNDSLASVSTIAYEGGHNVNHQYMLENNLPHYRRNSSVVAEVTSLMNECLLSNYLAEHGKNKDEKLMGLANIIEVFISNFYGAVREGKIEKEMYELVENNGTLTKEYLNDLVYKSKELYGGKHRELDEYTKNSWAVRSHYYMNFYLFSYSISIAVATSIANKIINGDKEVLNKYIEFLKAGSDKDITETFAILGINLEDKKVYEDAVKFFNSLLDKYEKIYNEE